MSDYDFNTLSPIDFENLCRDLMQKEFSVLLETFAPGRDQGIDFRGFISNRKSIIQCKHYSSTGFKGLYSTMKLKELPKILKISPERYFLFTSVQLTPKQKRRLYDLVQPHIKEEKDIFGKDDINNLLGRHPDIEKKHFKLWLSSINVLEKIFHSRILRESEQELEDITKKSKKYVINESFDKALSILHEYHYCIIAGIPGIGKTMLAKMVALQYINEGYEFLSISRDISDAYSIPFQELPRVYLYDDFLGRTSITEKLGKNEDHRLLSLIERIKDSPRERLILTTREYILHQAQNVYERLDSPFFNKPQCIVDLSSYTRRIRASILYNHLFFSDIKTEYIKYLLKKSIYFKIIDHPNFNPRIIEYLTDRTWISDLSSSEYPLNFLNALYNPIIIWEKVFTSQLSNLARLILTILTSFPSEIFLQDLKDAFMNHLIEQEHLSNVSIIFNNALRELEGNFTITHSFEKGTVISFHNPSIADFMQKKIENDALALFQILKHAIYFEQIEFILDSDFRHELLIDNFTESKKLLSEKIETLMKMKPCKLSYWPDSTAENSYKDRSWIRMGSRIGYIASKASNRDYSYLFSFIKTHLINIFHDIQTGRFQPTEIMHLLRHLAPLPVFRKNEKKKFLSFAKESIIEKSYSFSQLSEIFNFFTLYPQMQSSTDRIRLKKKVSNLVNDLSSEDDYELVDDELSSLKKIHESDFIDVSNEINYLEGLVSELEDSVESSHDPDREDHYTSSNSKDSFSNADISSMFSTLIETRKGR